MTDDLLARLDRALVPDAEATRPRPAQSAANIVARVRPARVVSRSLRDRFPWVEVFLGIQFLWGAFLFLPGAQAFRPVIRVMPYAAAVGMLVLFLPRVIKTRAPAGTIPLVLALALLAANLLHPTSQFGSGVAQCVFQAAIAAPMFWGWKAVSSPDRLRRLLWFALVLNTIGAVLGILQVYYPDRFMPPQFNTLGMRMNEFYVESLTYLGPNGERIVRPPGLSDQPGGAAVAGALAVVLGAGLHLAGRTPGAMVMTLGSVAVGLAAIYLTQVRSLLLVSVGALGVMAAVLFARGQVRRAIRISLSAAVLVVVSFLWARSLGGESINDRFVGIARQGAMRTYQENRGAFVSSTFSELLDEYPLGAGVGRWGMMNVYFSDPARLESPPLYVEIQITGWLLDGGVPMWILYGGAILLTMFATYRFTSQRVAPELSDVAMTVLAIQVLIVGFAWAGPVFNTQMGLLFWFMSSAILGAARGSTAAARG